MTLNILTAFFNIIVFVSSISYVTLHSSVAVVTVNDYLAQRDAEWMGRVHRFLGLSVGLIQVSHVPHSLCV